MEPHAESSDLLFLGNDTRISSIRDHQLLDTVPLRISFLIGGEPGTGHRLLARCLHRFGHRPSRPFVHVDCACLPPDGAVALLFGGQSLGAIQQAHTGTLFLENIDYLTAELQHRLAPLVAIWPDPEADCQRRELPFHLIASINHPWYLSRWGGLRSAALFDRLSAGLLDLPGLRERREDIPLLAAYFTYLAVQRCGYCVAKISPEALTLLQAQAWPGNVWQLKRTVEQAVANTGSNYLDTQDFLPLLPQRDPVVAIEGLILSDYLDYRWPATPSPSPPWSMLAVPEDPSTVPAAATVSDSGETSAVPDPVAPAPAVSLSLCGLPPAVITGSGVSPLTRTPRNGRSRRQPLKDPCR